MLRYFWGRFYLNKEQLEAEIYAFGRDQEYSQSTKFQPEIIRGSGEWQCNGSHGLVEKSSDSLALLAQKRHGTKVNLDRTIVAMVSAMSEIEKYGVLCFWIRWAFLSHDRALRNRLHGLRRQIFSEKSGTCWYYGEGGKNECSSGVYYVRNWEFMIPRLRVPFYFADSLWYLL